MLAQAPFVQVANETAIYYKVRGFSAGCGFHDDRLRLCADGERIGMIAPDVSLDEGVVIHHPRSRQPLRLPDRRRHPHRDVRRDPARAVIGAHCKISSHTFICEGVTIEDEVFVGHGVMFTTTCTRAP